MDGLNRGLSHAERTRCYFESNFASELLGPCLIGGCRILLSLTP
jgi:hypothetical protein